MAIGAPKAASPPDTLAGLAAAEGSAAHRWPRKLAVATRPNPRDLSDAIHTLLMLHGRHPGMIDIAGMHAEGAAAAWLAAAAADFADERAWLNRLAVAAGPLPSTPGHAQSEAAVLAQCHAIEMLARSDRAGCALGAAVALVLDWPAVRTLLDAAANRFGVAIAGHPLAPPPPAETLRGDATSPALVRALWFGARQMLVQHRQLWDLLETRAQARGAH